MTHVNTINNNINNNDMLLMLTKKKAFHRRTQSNSTYDLSTMTSHVKSLNSNNNLNIRLSLLDDLALNANTPSAVNTSSITLKALESAKSNLTEKQIIVDDINDIPKSNGLIVAKKHTNPLNYIKKRNLTCSLMGLSQIPNNELQINRNKMLNESRNIDDVIGLNTIYEKRKVEANGGNNDDDNIGDNMENKSPLLISKEIMPMKKSNGYLMEEEEEEDEIDEEDEETVKDFKEAKEMMMMMNVENIKDDSNNKYSGDIDTSTDSNNNSMVNYNNYIDEDNNNKEKEKDNDKEKDKEKSKEKEKEKYKDKDKEKDKEKSKEKENDKNKEKDKDKMNDKDKDKEREKKKEKEKTTKDEDEYNFFGNKIMDNVVNIPCPTTIAAGTVITTGTTTTTGTTSMLTSQVLNTQEIFNQNKNRFIENLRKKRESAMLKNEFAIMSPSKIQSNSNMLSKNITPNTMSKSEHICNNSAANVYSFNYTNNTMSNSTTTSNNVNTNNKIYISQTTTQKKKNERLKSRMQLSISTLINPSISPLSKLSISPLARSSIGLVSSSSSSNNKAINPMITNNTTSNQSIKRLDQKDVNNRKFFPFDSNYIQMIMDPISNDPINNTNNSNKKNKASLLKGNQVEGATGVGGTAGIRTGTGIGLGVDSGLGIEMGISTGSIGSGVATISKDKEDKLELLREEITILNSKSNLLEDKIKMLYEIVDQLTLSSQNLKKKQIEQDHKIKILDKINHSYEANTEEKINAKTTAVRKSHEINKKLTFNEDMSINMLSTTDLSTIESPIGIKSAKVARFNNGRIDQKSPLSSSSIITPTRTTTVGGIEDHKLMKNVDNNNSNNNKVMKMYNQITRKLVEKSVNTYRAQIKKIHSEEFSKKSSKLKYY